MLIMVMGLPGSGKTYFAQILSNKLKATHVSSDVIRTQVGKRGSYSPEDKLLVYNQMLELTEEELKNGKTVIVDSTFYKKNIRDQFINLGIKLGVVPHVVEITASESVIKDRLRKRRKFSEADFEVYMKIKDAFEPLTDKHLVLFSNGNNIDEMLEETLGFLSL